MRYVSNEKSQFIFEKFLRPFHGIPMIMILITLVCTRKSLKMVGTDNSSYFWKNCLAKLSNFRFHPDSTYQKALSG